VKSYPKFYDPARVGTLFYPDVARIAEEAEAARLRPADEDAQDVHLMIIDMQVDFCHEQGSLYVPGALGDVRRTIEFIYRNAARITHITCSLDSHVPMQIFSPAWWAGSDGAHPAPFTIITRDDVGAGTWRPLLEPEWSTVYVAQLEQRHRKQLCVWPYHVQIGGAGHALDPELWSAVFWHSLARRSQPNWLVKGNEHYSILGPEVPVPDEAGGELNKAFLEILARADAILIAGEAESHCVLETVEDLVAEFGDQPEMLRKVFFLRDCTSPVLHPEIDFHAIALSRFEEFARLGVNFIASTDPLPF
jgi:nicotinamidase/pyrazinamidase